MEISTAEDIPTEPVEGVKHREPSSDGLRDIMF